METYQKVLIGLALFVISFMLGHWIRDFSRWMRKSGPRGAL